MKAQIIERNGEPEYAVIPYAEYKRLIEGAELLEDIQDYDRIRVRLERGEEELVPASIAHRLAEGEPPIRVWREHRRLTVSALADRAGISQAYLSQIESGKHEGKASVLLALSRVLGVAVEDLMAS